MWDKRLEYLFVLYYQNKASDLERVELIAFLEEDEYQEQIKDLIANLILSDSADKVLSKGVSEDILLSIFQTTPNKQAGTNVVAFGSKRSRILSNWKYWLAAAMISGITILGGYSWIRSKQEAPLAEHRFEKDVQPGNDKAQLALWDGTVIELGSDTEGQMPQNSGIKINALEGEVVSDKNSNSVGYNTLKTPLGGQYKVVLPDGSRAWLNAGSSIRFPTTFTGSQRSVAMTGEVYFEIQPNRQMPFKVELPDKKVNGGNMEVTVLGTHFNISSYPDDPTINTTLVEGKVEIKQGYTKKVLLPGQQASVSHHSDNPDIRIKNVDALGVVAWKEGRFEFNGNIQDIMRQICRWYNVQVRYEGNTGNKAFMGAISRQNNISDVLKILELTGEIQFIVENGIVVVKPVPLSKKPILKRL